MRFQFGAWLMGVALSVMTVPSTFAQSKDHPAPRPQASRGADRPSRDNSGRSGGGYHPQNAPRHGASENRQPSYDNRRQPNDNRTYRDNRPQSQPRQSPAVPPPSAQDRLRSMSPQDRQKLAQREQDFRRLPPQKQDEMRRAADNWGRMTPEQRDHIRNDIMPKWKSLAPDRQKAIQQRLGVLRNMPESARNRHLADPNFTRGMSEEDKQLLHDLSHEHIGAPDQHPEQ